MRDQRPRTGPIASELGRAHLLALSRWETEGRAGLAPIGGGAPLRHSAETDPLRMRGIALENLVIALLADATEHERALARGMADFISPRPGYTPHPLTPRAADAMRSLVERAERFNAPTTRRSCPRA